MKKWIVKWLWRWFKNEMIDEALDAAVKRRTAELEAVTQRAQADRMQELGLPFLYNGKWYVVTETIQGYDGGMEGGEKK